MPCIISAPSACAPSYRRSSLLLGCWYGGTDVDLNLYLAGKCGSVTPHGLMLWSSVASSSRWMREPPSLWYVLTTKPLSTAISSRINLLNTYTNTSSSTAISIRSTQARQNLGNSNNPRRFVVSTHNRAIIRKLQHPPAVVVESVLYRMRHYIVRNTNKPLSFVLESTTAERATADGQSCGRQST